LCVCVAAMFEPNCLSNLLAHCFVYVYQFPVVSDFGTVYFMCLCLHIRAWMLLAQRSFVCMLVPHGSGTSATWSWHSAARYVCSQLVACAAYVRAAHVRQTGSLSERHFAFGAQQCFYAAYATSQRVAILGASAVVHGTAVFLRRAGGISLRVPIAGRAARSISRSRRDGRMILCSSFPGLKVIAVITHHFQRYRNSTWHFPLHLYRRLVE
jgi:hypothetical protein